IRLLAYASLNNKEITIELAKEVLRDIVNITNKTITLDEIKQEVANYFNIDKEELDTKRRTQDINTPRQIAIYLTRTLTDYSLPMIGKFFGGRDHSTIIHAYEKIKKEIEINETLKVAVEEITNRLMFN
ncbi:MAG TPA: helix-turn-helix domain-containing protein, partial [Caldisericia bacterium]|nr:helix-turn-helix domain-containing protein [Caldisericia bacterium]